MSSESRLLPPVRGQIQYGAELLDTSGLRYPTGLPGFGAFLDITVQGGTGSQTDPLTVPLNSYVNRIRYTGPNCAVTLPRGSPGTIVYVMPDVETWVATPPPLTVWVAPGHDQIYVAGSAGGDIDRQSIIVENATVAMFIAMALVFTHAGRPPVLGCRWRALVLNAPGAATPGALTAPIKSYY